MNDDMLTIKLDPELKKEFMEIAKSKDRTISQLLRGLIRFYVDAHKHKGTAKAFKKLDF